MNVLGYTESGSIRIEIDGIEMVVPDDMGNRHRQMISEWEAAGNTIPPAPNPKPTAEDAISERERRLALGLTYDFGDDRGVHVIGTTPEDMKRWIEEVTPFASALVASGNPDGTINLLTNSGHATVTAMEWQQILVAAGEQRQSIYEASFSLQAMNPIPQNFVDDVYWL